MSGLGIRRFACRSDGDSDGDWDKRVWVAVSKWSNGARTAILDNLDRLDAAGCDVKVLISDAVSADQRQNLRSRLSGDPSASDKVRVICDLHHKFLLIDAKYDGPYREAVITGSHIYATGSLYNSGEFNIRVGGQDSGVDNNVARDCITHYQMHFDRAPQDSCG